MEIVHLDKTCLYKALAKECNWDHYDADCWYDTIGIGCPFSASEDEDTVDCNMITAGHWREVFEGKDGPEPEFRFGDKVSHCIDFPVRAVFSAYKESPRSGEAYVLFDDSPECEVVLVKNLKAGWE